MCLCFLGLVCTRVVCLLKGFAGVFWFAQALTPLISNCARLHVGLMQQGWFATDCYKLNTYIYIYTSNDKQVAKAQRNEPFDGSIPEHPIQSASSGFLVFG